MTAHAPNAVNAPVYLLPPRAPTRFVNETTTAFSVCGEDARPLHSLHSLLEKTATVGSRRRTFDTFNTSSPSREAIWQ